MPKKNKPWLAMVRFVKSANSQMSDAVCLVADDSHPQFVVLHAYPAEAGLVNIFTQTREQCVPWCQIACLEIWKGPLEYTEAYKKEIELNRSIVR
mgnify:CR=1 FL=1